MAAREDSRHHSGPVRFLAFPRQTVRAPLRALEDWMTHAVVKANDNGAGVDGRADLERVERTISHR